MTPPPIYCVLCACPFNQRWLYGWLPELQPPDPFHDRLPHPQQHVLDLARARNYPIPDNAFDHLSTPCGFGQTGYVIHNGRYPDGRHFERLSTENGGCFTRRYTVYQSFAMHTACERILRRVMGWGKGFRVTLRGLEDSQQVGLRDDNIHTETKQIAPQLPPELDWNVVRECAVTTSESDAIDALELDFDEKELDALWEHLQTADYPSLIERELLPAARARWYYQTLAENRLEAILENNPQLKSQRALFCDFLRSTPDERLDENLFMVRGSPLLYIAQVGRNHDFDSTWVPVAETSWVLADPDHLPVTEQNEKKENADAIRIGGLLPSILSEVHSQKRSTISTRASPHLLDLPSDILIQILLQAATTVEDPWKDWRVECQWMTLHKFSILSKQAYILLHDHLAQTLFRDLCRYNGWWPIPPTSRIPDPLGSGGSAMDLKEYYLRCIKHDGAKNRWRITQVCRWVKEKYTPWIHSGKPKKTVL